MTETELDNVYGEFCRAVSEAGEARAPVLLAQFALLAMSEINDAARVLTLLKRARAAGNVGLAEPNALP